MNILSVDEPPGRSIEAFKAAEGRAAIAEVWQQFDDAFDYQAAFDEIGRTCLT